MKGSAQFQLVSPFLGILRFQIPLVGYSLLSIWQSIDRQSTDSGQQMARLCQKVMWQADICVLTSSFSIIRFLPFSLGTSLMCLFYAYLGIFSQVLTYVDNEILFYHYDQICHHHGHYCLFQWKTNIHFYCNTLWENYHALVRLKSTQWRRYSNNRKWNIFKMMTIN